MTKENHLRVLVVSNNGFSKTSNNGRTLGNLFINWPKEKLAQFCISTADPDYDLCNNYYLLTDKSVLDGFIHFRKGYRCVLDENKGSEGNTIIGGKKMVKTPLKALFRYLVWSKERWNSSEFKEWIDSFNPEVVLVMNSDAIFVLDIAYKISKTRRIPLVLFNTEGYFFFNCNYFSSSRFCSNTLFKIYQIIYKRHFRRMMSQVSLSIHLNSSLKKDYYNEFGGNHMILYTGSSVAFDSSSLNVNNPTFSYLGNFGYNRPKALVEVAKTLQSINHNYYLDIYGNAPRKEIIDILESEEGIRFYGMIPYEKVVEVIKNSTILFHVEAQDESLKESLKYGFSTKIADSISSGRCFVMYSSLDVAGAKYIKETDAGWLADNLSDLRQIVLSILTNAEERNHVLSIARRIATENHDIKRNSIRFRQALLSVL